MEQTRQEALTESPASRWRWLRWGLLLVPLLAAVELAAHWVQVRRTIPAADWHGAAELTRQLLGPDDLLIIAPWWIEPTARMHLGDDLMTAERVARPDESRFKRAVQLSVRGKHAPELMKWAVGEQRTVGSIHLKVLVNPSYEPVIDDLLRHVTPSQMQVARATGSQEQPCRWQRSRPRAGSLGAGPAIPAERYACPQGGEVAITIIPALDYSARRCIYAPPPGGPAALRIRFPRVQFGRSLVGHHGLNAESERDLTGTPVTIAFRSAGQPLGNAIHEDGQGWVEFRLDTSALEGQTADLEADVTSRSGARRMYCFEATTR